MGQYPMSGTVNPTSGTVNPTSGTVNPTSGTVNPTSGRIEAGNTHNTKLPALLRLYRLIQTLFRLSQIARERVF
jgi:hypothetical protein